MAPLRSNPDTLIRQFSYWTACSGAEESSTSGQGARDPEARGRGFMGPTMGSLMISRDPVELSALIKLAAGSPDRRFGNGKLAPIQEMTQASDKRADLNRRTRRDGRSPTDS